jgi:catechol 2,3-dioxygenase-like lactoylglutathione lyase family enzyme
MKEHFQMDGIDEIYPMPSFPMLSVSDAAKSSRWYQDSLGFTHVFTMNGPDDTPSLVHLRWVKYADLLMGPRPSVAEPRGAGVVLNFSAYLAGRTVDEIAARAEAAGATIVSPPGDRPWNARDCTIADPDGYQLTFSEPINIGRSFDAVVENARRHT